MIDLRVCLVTSKIVYHIFFLTKKNPMNKPMAQNNTSYSLIQILKEKLKKARRKKNPIRYKWCLTWKTEINQATCIYWEVSYSDKAGTWADSEGEEIR